MPRYDYECTNCEHTFYGDYKIDDRIIPTNNPCPNCDTENTVIQVIGAPGFACAYRLGRMKPTQDFQDRMKDIKKNTKSLITKI